MVPHWPVAIQRARLAMALTAVLAGAIAAGCGILVETPPAPTPADFQGIAADLVRHGIRIDHVVSGEAGCDDPTLMQTAIAIDASGLDQTETTRLYVYIFRNREAFERLRQTVDTCASAYVSDPAAYEVVDTSPFVVAGDGPWGPDFRGAVRAAMTEAAGTGD